MRRRTALAVAASIAAFACNADLRDSGDETTSGPAGRILQYRVHDAVDRADDLVRAGVDLLEKRTDNDLFVLGNEDTGQTLRALGLAAEVDKEYPMLPWDPSHTRHLESSGLAIDETYYGGYHTLRAHYAHLDKVAREHPDLAKVVTYGQSWMKQQRRGGYDLEAICLTAMNEGSCSLDPNSAKPRFLLYTQIHAREIGTGDIAWRWIDYLANGYASDGVVKALLDTEEMWVVPIANPDGVEIVERGGSTPYWQRKNANVSNEGSTPCSRPHHGVDLNRNFDSHWGGASSSTDVCNDSYLGPHADSEVETTSSENLWRQLFPVVRAANPSAPSPPNAKGMVVILHSSASRILYPWYHANLATPNDATQRAIAARLGSMTGYAYGRSGQVLYLDSGSADDWIYEKLGTSVFTIELGDPSGGPCDGFFPKYRCQSSLFWPKLLPALIYAAQRAAAPFQPQ